MTSDPFKSLEERFVLICVLTLIQPVFSLVLLLPGCYAITASRIRFRRACTLKRDANVS